MAILSLLMKFLSRLMASNTASGEQLIKKAGPVSGTQPMSGAQPKRSECCGYGEVVDEYLQKRRDGAAAKRFF
jgi:hypothetical protein